MSNKGRLQTQFAELTGVTAATAKKYLEGARYDLARAVDTYYDRHPNKASAGSVGTPAEKSDPKATAALNAVFDGYKDPNDTNQIDIDGTLRYLEDLQITPEDLSSLTLAYLLKSPKMGIFLRDSFIKVWEFNRCIDIASMRAFLTKFHNSLINGEQTYTDALTGEPATFQKLYDFTFKFSLELEHQKVLDFDISIEYWRLLIPVIVSQYIKENNPMDEEYESKVDARVEQWFTFLTDSEYITKKSISHDSWSMFYLFLKEVVLPDPENFKDYDEMAAWPSIVDEFIEYLRDTQLLT
ncbi:Defective in cullin neddylation protein 1 [Candida viswanathii]|uniref:Defective in cullin neddylation protein n=1 Tax=Candida viswanathii TaxID=5486 RepID=A0A367YFV3_9ASCO|nr:Defective in cullin neddylation protein 1 [Candida viswanathii]